MPASHKMLKSREQAKNRAAGIGDEQGRLASRVKPAEVMARCTICSLEIRITKKNIEAKAHFESRHPSSTFAECWPGCFDPTVVAVATPPAPSASASAASSSTSSSSSSASSSSAADSSAVADEAVSSEPSAIASTPVAAPKKKKPVQDLSFLNASLGQGAGGGGKRK